MVCVAIKSDNIAQGAIVIDDKKIVSQLFISIVWLLFDEQEVYHLGRMMSARKKKEEKKIHVLFL